MPNRIQPCELYLSRCSGLNIFCASDWTLSFKISERENLTDTPIDLSGYHGLCNIKYSLKDDNPICQPSVDTYADGTVVVSMPASMTKNIVVAGKTYNDVLTLQYEILLIDDVTGEVFRSLWGQVDCIGSTFDATDNNN